MPVAVLKKSVKLGNLQHTNEFTVVFALLSADLTCFMSRDFHMPR